ncbi:Por [Symbiodinium natans]|uniref:NADPH--hemoprotein reductase n=1 Tax=Symbiodinium natans TaxID=878477 RepID=A0A812TWA6_9DINO|nr:Por [Symbiodinium natans]
MELYNNYLVDLLRPIDWQGTPPRMPFCVEGNGGEQRGEQSPALSLKLDKLGMVQARGLGLTGDPEIPEALQVGQAWKRLPSCIFLRTDAVDILKIGVALAVVAAVCRLLWVKTSKKNKEEASRADASPKNRSGTTTPRSSNSAADGLWIYFGSQTGTAEGFAQELEQEAATHEISAAVVDLEDFDPETFRRHKAVVMVLATYGEGDPTDNAAEFFKWLEDDSLDTDYLKGMKFTVMGCGNRQYVHFNQSARIADQRLECLGAERVYERGEGDDDQNIEEDFEQWRENGLWPALRKALGLSGADHLKDEQAVESAESVLKRLPLKLELSTNMRTLPVDPLVQVGGADILGKWYFQASLAPVVACDELRQKPDVNAGKTTKHIEFNVQQLPAVDWRTADNLEVLPENPHDLVQWFAERLGVADQLESHLTFIRSADTVKAVKKPFPAPCTVQTALSLYCDLCAVHKACCKRLVPFVRDEADSKALQALLQDREAFQILADGRMSMRDFFELFMESAEIDLSAFVQLCQRQKNRPYTIASSSKEDPNRIAICVSLVQEERRSPEAAVKDLIGRGIQIPRATAFLQKLGETAAKPRKFRGLCSEMLCTRTQCGAKHWIYARASTFRLPRRTTLPIVMIGAGTGLAPFRGFVREFKAENGCRTKTILFFGCTKRDEDYIYKEELSEAVEMKPPALKELITAFSREQKEKVYVQHRLKEKSAEVKQLIADGGYIYVCGATSMGKQVRDELELALGSADYLERLKTEQRYVEAPQGLGKSSDSLTTEWSKCLQSRRIDGPFQSRPRTLQRCSGRVEGLAREPAKSVEELKAVFQRGLDQRAVAENAMNAESSRSHVIFTVFLTQDIPSQQGGVERTTSKLHFCDLGGCERLKKTEVEQDRDRRLEAIEINKSLSALGDVIEAIAKKRKYIPYRNHKLTQLLQDALGGRNGDAALIVWFVLIVACHVLERASLPQDLQKNSQEGLPQEVHDNVNDNRLFLEPEDSEVASMMESRRVDKIYGNDAREARESREVAQWELMPPPPQKESGCTKERHEQTSLFGECSQLDGFQCLPVKTGVVATFWQNCVYLSINDLRCQTIRITNLIKGLKSSEVESVFSSKVGPVRDCNVRDTTARITFDAANHAKFAVDKFNGSILEATAGVEKQDSRVLQLQPVPWNSAGTVLREMLEKHFSYIIDSDCHYRRGDCWLTFASVKKVQAGTAQTGDQLKILYKGSIIKVVLDSSEEAQATGIIKT